MITMKKYILLFIIYLGWSLSMVVYAAVEVPPQKIISKNIQPEEGAADFDDDFNDPFRTKRQHGHGGHNQLSGLLNSVLNKKLGLLGSLSSISSSSSGADKHASVGPSYEYATPMHKPSDWLPIKKSIKASLLQAVKAITGGVIVLNGQLVKVKGHLLTAGGQLLSAKGDKITAFGGHLATYAFPSHHHMHHTEIHESAQKSTVSEYGVSGPDVAYNSERGFPNHYIQQGIQYPSGYNKNDFGYAKRATSGSPEANAEHFAPAEITV